MSRSFLYLTIVFLLGACSTMKKKKAAPVPMDEMSGVEEGLEVGDDSDSGKAGGLQTVYFAFNSAILAGETKEALRNNADFMKENTSLEIQIEGHCDERGGVQYNLALGEKRAKGVKRYLVSLGVPSERMETISFGKEKPLSYGHDEESWSKNRRANFVITSK